MKFSWKLIVVGMFFVVLTACSSKDAELKSEQTSKEYQEWKQQVEVLLNDKPYILPSYDPELGPIEMVYDQLSPTNVSFELYRSKTYKISNELTGVGTIHDFYYSFSWNKEGKEWSDSEILYRLAGGGTKSKIERKIVDANKTIINDMAVEYRDGNLRFYQSFDIEGHEPNKDLSEAVFTFLKAKGISSAQVEAIKAERETNLDFQFVVNNHYVKSSFSIQSPNELEKYLGEISKLVIK
ncbi:hypothetical protein [uncultured Brevibacillus sp.]|uniref:hypothetical protein n=1 Tax=uncultured Brevibacillus sp. TaxID=169970 RepID=UPI0025972D52|nr:hypothetical protein [uncultured Brevibacillus sp.]